jgi:hypothetical protein
MDRTKIGWMVIILLVVPLLDPDQIDQFTADRKTALSQLGLNFSCRSCLVSGGSASVLTDAQLKESAYGYHDRPSRL